MEEKRYVIRYDLDYNKCLIDTEENQGVGDIFKVVNLLNQQDKRIKELEETNKLLSNELTKNSILKQDHIETCCGIPIFEIPKMKQENEQLKHKLHDLPKKIVEEITNELSNNTSLYFEIRESTSIHCPNKEYEWFNYVRFRNYINTILKKYGGGNE